MIGLLPGVRRIAAGLLFKPDCRWSVRSQSIVARKVAMKRDTQNIMSC
jgi:hypothetical protein